MTTNTLHGSRGAARRSGRGSWVSVFQNWNTSRATRKALSQLSDRELDDIGLTRGDIRNF